MLCLLKIRNLALVEELEIEFASGLNVLTGETGSGKTVILEAVALLLGERARPGAVRKGAKRGQVQAVFDLERRPEIRQWLETENLLSEDSDELVIRRDIPAEGRSRATINGRLVTVSQLADLGARLAAVHSQHDSVRLTSSPSQRHLFDAYGGHGDALKRTRDAWQAWRQTSDVRQRLESDDLQWRQRLDFLQFQIREIEELSPAPGEEEHLAAERARLTHAETLRTSSAHVTSLLAEGQAGEPAALDHMGAAQQEMTRMLRLDPSLSALAEALEEVAARLDDITRDVADYTGSLETDPHRLGQVDERLDALRTLTRKHGCDTSALPGLLRGLCTEAETLENRDSMRDDATRHEERTRKALTEAADGLTAIRRRTATRFAKEAEKLLRELGMPAARFRVELKPLATDGVPSAEGAETVRFLLSANTGEDVRAISEVASGGELSRITLALHALAAGREGITLHVFDEVDSGLSGKAAVRMGTVLEKLACAGQVICATHQATIASRADRHVLIRKQTRGGTTRTAAELLEEDARRNEVARLLDGSAGARSLELAAEMIGG